MSNCNNRETTALAQAVLSLKSTAEVKNFLRDLLTEQEIIEFGKRFKAAKMLDRSVSYLAIEKETGLSSTTIARVSRWLRKGMGGYRLVISRLSHHANPSGK